MLASARMAHTVERLRHYGLVITFVLLALLALLGTSNPSIHTMVKQQDDSSHRQLRDRLPVLPNAHAATDAHTRAEQTQSIG